MDKAEYRIATEHIKKLIAKGEYAEASHIADTIDWSRVKSVMMLCTVSDLYKINRRYEDAKEILYMAYERNPESRTILYSLCDLSIKLEEFVAAIEYYKSFVEVAPRDTGRYVLQYRLYQAQDVGLEERIDVLEQLKSEEYTEKWAYELAYLYHRIGFATKCVEECDELILWFGTGRYVYKAMELKMLHEPLTPSQQRTYDQRFEHLEQAKDMTRVLPRIDSGDSEMTDESMVDVTDAPTVEIPKEYIEKELHSEPEEIQVKTLDVANAYNTMNLQKELAESLREILEGTQAESITEEAQADEPTIVAAEVVDAVNKVIQEPAAEVVLELAENESVPEVPEVIIEDVTAIVEEAMVNDQITGQLSIDDIFAAIEAEMKKDLFTVAEETSVETEEAPDEEETAVVEEEHSEDENIFEETMDPEIEEISDEEEVFLEEKQFSEEDSLDEIEAALEAASDAYAEEFAAQQGVKVVLEEEEEEYAEPEEAMETPVPVEEPVSEAAPKETLQESKVDDTTGQDFSKYEDFIRSKDTEEQIAAAKERISMEPMFGNVAVTGHDLSICFDFIKVFMTDLKKQGFDIKGKTAKISAVNLNKKEPSEIIKRVQGGILIIERAGRLRKETVAKIEACLKEDISSILVFVTDTDQGMNRFAERYSSLAKLVNLRVDIKDYSGEELVTYAVKYAYDQEYSIDEMGLLALRTRIDEMIADDDAPTMNDAQHVIDEAMEHANQKNFKHFMDVLLRKRYDDEDMIILREEDFL